MLLLNSADSHETEEYNQLAYAYNIILLRYLPCFIYLKQLLDVRYFQTYKL